MRNLSDASNLEVACAAGIFLLAFELGFLGALVLSPKHYLPAQPMDRPVPTYTEPIMGYEDYLAMMSGGTVVEELDGQEVAFSRSDFTAKELQTLGSMLRAY